MCTSISPPFFCCFLFLFLFVRCEGIEGVVKNEVLEGVTLTIRTKKDEEEISCLRKFTFEPTQTHARALSLSHTQTHIHTRTKKIHTRARVWVHVYTRTHARTRIDTHTNRNNVTPITPKHHTHHAPHQIASHHIINIPSHHHASHHIITHHITSSQGVVGGGHGRRDCDGAEGTGIGDRPTLMG